MTPPPPLGIFLKIHPFWWGHPSLRENNPTLMLQVSWLKHTICKIFAGSFTCIGSTPELDYKPFSRVALPKAIRISKGG